VPTLTALLPNWLVLQPADLLQLRPLPQLRWLQWRDPLPLTAAQSLQVAGALDLSGLTTLHLFDGRFSDEHLEQLLSPLTQLQELMLNNFVALSAAFLLSGSLPRTLRLCASGPTSPWQRWSMRCPC